MPRPSAASKRMIAWAVEPRDGADDRGQRGRDEERVAQAPAGAEADDLRRRCSEEPASAAKTMISTRPMSSVRLAPIRLETTPVTSIATPMTAM